MKSKFIIVLMEAIINNGESPLEINMAGIMEVIKYIIK